VQVPYGISFYMLTNADMAKVKNFDVVSAIFKAVGICASENYKQKWLTKLCNY
jgi:hypothetical protein